MDAPDPVDPPDPPRQVSGYDPTSALHLLPLKKRFVRRRWSSFDRTGGNRDWTVIPASETRVLGETAGAGCIRHLWCTIGVEKPSERLDRHHLRKIVIRMYWDGSDRPSVEVPIGDFFGMGHGRSTNFVAAPLQMSPESGKAFNCWFPMPFGAGARIEVVNECRHDVMFFFYVDWEEYPALDDDVFRFHAWWNRERTQGISDEGIGKMDFQMGGTNLSDADNYVLLDVHGEGHYVGCNLNIDNQRGSWFWDWPGEGDDMIVVDDEPFPPELHGTGTEDYVNLAFCPTQRYSAPYHGLIRSGGINWAGKLTYYRYHILDPVPFERSIRVSIEHGHANRRSDDWSSTAYWYQRTIADLPPLPPVEERLPLPERYPLRRLLGAVVAWPAYHLVARLRILIAASR